MDKGQSNGASFQLELYKGIWGDVFTWTRNSIMVLAHEVFRWISNNMTVLYTGCETQGARWDQKIKRLRRGRWSWTFKLARKRSWVGRCSWAAKVGLLSLQVVLQQQCNGHCLCDFPSTAVETAIARCSSRWAIVRGHRLNTSIVLAAVHGLSGLFRAVSTVEPALFRPLPLLSPSLISHLTSVDIKQNGPGVRLRQSDNNGFVCVQEKLEKRLEDVHYNLESRVIKLEELLADSRNHIADVQMVSTCSSSKSFQFQKDQL